GGWLAGRGALEWPPRAPDRLTARLRAGVASRGRLLAAAGAVALAGSAAWAAWQPQRSIDAGNDALDALDASPPQIQAARKLAKSAQQRDPLSIQPYFDQAAIETKAHDNPGARRALEAAIRLQPANPETWIALADFQLHQLKHPRAAFRTLSAALYLDPKSIPGIQLLIETNRLLTTATS
ncbi:MAG: hypothetical protein QOG68_1863, partial [Solirubrobacteraceae bacterium]|nr:hypothetical protein [Solirubrobacteraceae bacterium]